MSSEEKEFLKDVFITIPYKPVEKDGSSNKYYYEKIIKNIASELKNMNFRVIDNNQELVIRVKNQDNKALYTINGDNNFFENEMVKYSSNMNSNEEDISIEIKSNELKTIIDNDWNKIDLKNKLGSIDSSCNKYDYYFDEGYKIKSINIEVFNMVFTKRYSNEVFDGIKTGLSNEVIKEKLGKPKFQGEDIYIIGYETKELCLFFYDGNISVYRKKEYDEEKNNQFAKIVTSLLTEKNYNEFMHSVMGLYPDYDRYEESDGKFEITYPMEGMSIEFSNIKSGITLYSNYKGKINEDLTIDDVKNGKQLQNGFYYNSINSLFSTELYRISETNNKYKITKQPNITNDSSKFNVINKDGMYRFYSINEMYYDSEFSSNDVSSIFSISDDSFVYGKRGDGIYLYNATNKENKKISEGNGECKIIKVEDKIVYYDNDKVEVR